MNKAPSIPHEPTPVDDVRRVRERLTQEAGGDIAKLAEQAERATEKLRERLHIKVVDLPEGTGRGETIAG